MSWQPDPDSLSQLLQVLQYADSGTTEAQLQVVQQLEHFSKHIPAFSAYLAYIFALCRSESENVRLRAGLALKVNVQQRLAAFPGEVLAYVKEAIWAGFEDESLQIRNAAASIIDWLIRMITPASWPESIVKLLGYMNSPNQLVQEAAFKAIANISRQSPRVLADLQVENNKPFDAILPLLIQNMQSQSTLLRALSVEALTPFIVSQPPAMEQQLQPFLSNLFGLTSDPSIRIRKSVVENLNTLLSFWAEKIIPHVEPVIDFMLFCLQSKDEEEELALSAAEFLLTFTEEPDLFEQLQNNLERFLPGLLQSMTFTPSSREVLDLDEDDYQKEDKSTDIKPHIHKSRHAGASTGVPSLAARMGMTADDIAAANGDDDEDEEEDEDEDGDDSEWTVRRAAARALELSAELFEGALLEILLPQVTQMLQKGDWFQREAAVHALGCVADGCGTAMHDHLPSVVPFLLESLRDQHPLIRSSAARTLGAYSSWIAESSNNGQDFLGPTIAGLLTVALDNNKHAQRNAITAFGSLAKEAGSAEPLKAHLQEVVHAFVSAFAKYQHKNLLKLYDAIAQLSDGLGLGGLDDPVLLNQLMPPLIERWQTFGDDDENLLYLLECLTSLIVAAGPGFKPFAEPVLERAFRLVHMSLYQYQQYTDDPNSFDKPEKSWMVVSLDLISSLVQALGSDAETALASFVQVGKDGSMPLLLVCLSYPENSVKQSTYALIGDLATSAVNTFFPIMDQLFNVMTESINPSPRLATSSVDSNAVWATGELAKAVGPSVGPYVPAMLERMVPILSSIRASANLLENTAIAIGLLAQAAPQQVAPHVGDIIKLWAQTMVHVRRGPEQDAALQGMCLAVQANPSGLQDGGHWLLEALTLVEKPSGQLRQVSTPIIEALRS